MLIQCHTCFQCYISPLGFKPEFPGKISPNPDREKPAPDPTFKKTGSSKNNPEPDPPLRWYYLGQFLLREKFDSSMILKGI